MLQDYFYRHALTSIFVLGMCLPSAAVFVLEMFLCVYF